MNVGGALVPRQFARNAIRPRIAALKGDRPRFRENRGTEGRSQIAEANYGVAKGEGATLAPGSAACSR